MNLLTFLSARDRHVQPFWYHIHPTIREQFSLDPPDFQSGFLILNDILYRI